MTLLSKDFVYSQHSSSDLLNKIFSDVDFHNFWESLLTREEHFDFFNKTLSRTLESLIQGNYTNFDAHTTSNCCHGMANLVRLLIHSAWQIDLKKFLCFQSLTINSIEDLQEIPYQILALIGLYILTYSTRIDPQKSRRTSPQKLKEYSSLGTQFVEKLVRNLQKNFSNIVAFSYLHLFEDCDPEMDISSVPLSFWGEYVQRIFLKNDFKNIYYAPCLYSMQITLGFLIASRAKIVIVNDLMTSDRRKVKGRYLRILQGNGVDGFKSISSEALNLIEPIEKKEAVLVFSGCAFADRLELDSLSIEMDKWLFQFPNLVLACDIHYPQFPNVSNDPSFNSSKIEPNNPALKNVIVRAEKISGVSSKDPSLFFLTHIYPASLGQILKEIGEGNALPFSLTNEFALT